MDKLTLISIEPIKSVSLKGYSKEESEFGLHIFSKNDYLFAAKHM
jgi:hypothetical protein